MVFMKRICLFVICLVFFSFEIQANEKSVFIIQSKDIAPYNDALRGIKDNLSKEFKINQSFVDQKNLKNLILKEDSFVVVTIGTEASLFAKDNFKDVPIVFTMVLDPTEIKLVSSLESRDELITGVMLGISIDDQFKKMKEVLPEIKKIGMLYDKNKKEQLRARAQKAAEKLNLKLVAQEINDASQVTKGLDKIITQSDILWAGVDTLIYNPQSAQHILLETLRNKLPFMAFSSQYVKAGALMALESDYYDIGRQTSDIVNQILEGRPVSDIPIESPQKLNLITNQNTAKLIGVSVPMTP